jgi:hypothetical protein
MFSATSEDSVQKRAVGVERFTDSDKQTEFWGLFTKNGIPKSLECL